MPILNVQILGDFRITYQHSQVAGLHQPRMQSVLAYLLLHRETIIPRQSLALRFWPDSSEQQAQTNLRQLLHYLRRLLPDSERLLQIDSRTIAWKPQISWSLDLAIFESQLDQARLAERSKDAAAQFRALDAALKVYQGDLLPDCSDEWVLPAREQLYQRYIQALAQAANLAEHDGNYPTAISYTRQLLQSEPLHEASYLSLMELYSAQGDRSSALRTYQECAIQLERELGISPNSQLQDTYQRLIRSQHSPDSINQDTTTRSALPALVGRRSELRILKEAWRQAARGQTSLAVLAGEAGIGKTRLAEELATVLSQQGIAVAHARAYGIEGHLAFAAVAAWLRLEMLRPYLSGLDSIWLTELSRIMPELLIERHDLHKPTPISSGWERKTLFEAITKAFQSYPEPLLLILDDLQWCDQDTLEWLSYMIQGNNQHKLLVVATLRSEERDRNTAALQLIQHTRNLNRIIEIEISALTMQETALLTYHLQGRSLDPLQLDDLYSQTKGNPLFLVESMRAEPARKAVSAPSTDSVVESSQTWLQLLSPKILAIFQSRLARLSPTAHELIDIAAAIGQNFSTSLLAIASGLDDTSILQGIAELWQAHLIREDETTQYDFRHDRIRELVYTAMSRAQREVHHRRIANALEHIHTDALNPVVARLAWHYEYGQRPQEAIAAYQRAAVVAYETFSVHDVISLLRRARTLIPALPHERSSQIIELEVLTALATALTTTYGFVAQEDETEYIFIRAWQLCAELDMPPQAIPVLAGLWMTTQMLGRFDEARTWALALDDLVLQKYPQHTPLACHACSGILYFRGELAHALSYCQRCIEWEQPAQEQGIFALGYNPATVVHCYYAHILWLLGDTQQAEHSIQYACDLTQSSQEPFEYIFVLSMAAVLKQFTGQIAEAYKIASRALMLAQERDAYYWVHHNNAILNWALMQQAAPLQGAAEVENHVKTFFSLGARAPFTYYCLLLIEAHAVQGNITEGLQSIDEALAHIRSSHECWLESEIYRWQGEFFAMQSDYVQSEAAFRQGLAIAQQQGALSLALRSAISLCHLQQKHKHIEDALPLLSQIYEQIPQKLETHDLQRAKFLLSQA